MDDLLFSVRAPAWWTLSGVAAAVAFAVALWRRATSPPLAPAVRGLARLGIVLLVPAGAVALQSRNRHGVDVYAARLEVTPMFSAARQRYDARQVRWYDELNTPVGAPGRQRLKRTRILGFSDGSEVRLLETLPNYDRLTAWLVRHGVAERSPFERPSARPPGRP